MAAWGAQYEDGSLSCVLSFFFSFVKGGFPTLLNKKNGKKREILAGWRATPHKWVISKKPLKPLKCLLICLHCIKTDSVYEATFANNQYFSPRSCVQQAHASQGSHRLSISFHWTLSVQKRENGGCWGTKWASTTSYPIMSWRFIPMHRIHGRLAYLPIHLPWKINHPCR